jgi:hypothetical protein
MKKFISIRFTRNSILLIGAIFGLLAFPASAQNASPAPAKNIGPAPFNSKQHQILDSALSSETRQTLQEAMNSVGTTSTAKSSK